MSRLYLEVRHKLGHPMTGDVDVLLAISAELGGRVARGAEGLPEVGGGDKGDQ